MCPWLCRVQLFVSAEKQLVGHKHVNIDYPQVCLNECIVGSTCDVELLQEVPVCFQHFFCELLAKKCFPPPPPWWWFHISFTLAPSWSFSLFEFYLFAPTSCPASPYHAHTSTIFIAKSQTSDVPRREKIIPKKWQDYLLWQKGPTRTISRDLRSTWYILSFDGSRHLLTDNVFLKPAHVTWPNSQNKFA